MTSLGWTFEPSGHPVEFLSLSGKLGRPGPGVGPLVRAAAARQGPRPQRHADVDPGAHLQVLRRQRPAAARPQGPHRHPEVPRVRRGQADPGRVRRDVERVGRRAPALDRRARAGRRGRLLRRARVRGRRSPAHDARRRGHRQHPRAVGRHGPAAAVLHVHALDARPAVRVPARGGRPAEAEAVLLLRRGAPPVRRRVAGADGPDRADGAAHPLEGRRRLLRHPGPDRRAVAGPRPARQPRPARPPGVHARRRRRAAQDRADVPDDRVLRRREDDHVARDRRGARHRAVPEGRAHAARRDPPAGARFAHGADRRGPVPGPHRDEPVPGRSTARPSTATAPTSGSRPRSRRPARHRPPRRRMPRSEPASTRPRRPA